VKQGVQKSWFSFATIRKLNDEKNVMMQMALKVDADITKKADYLYWNTQMQKSAEA